MLEYDEARTSPARIMVFGVGGGGSNAVNRMIQAGLTGVDFWIANTDLQALEHAVCPNRLQIGCAVTRGLGAGGDPEIGRLAAEEDREAIGELLHGSDMVFITAGMGGGTGTGGAPVIAAVARELGILTVAIVTRPFAFEGKKKMSRALAGIGSLSGNVDTLIVIPNQKLLNIVEPSTPFREALLVADEVLFQATRGISDLIIGHGEVNLDFADVKTVMRNKGNALLGCGVASGKNRAVEAAQAAVSSPLLEEVSISGAEALLINVQGGPSMGLHEAAEAAEFISERVGEEADVFWGAVVDPSLGDEMRVTLIATGFPRPAAAASGSTSIASEPASLLGRVADLRSEPPIETVIRRRPVVEPVPIAMEAASALGGPPLESRWLESVKAGELQRPEPETVMSAEAAMIEPMSIGTRGDDSGWSERAETVDKETMAIPAARLDAPQAAPFRGIESRLQGRIDRQPGDPRISEPKEDEPRLVMPAGPESRPIIPIRPLEPVRGLPTEEDESDEFLPAGWSASRKPEGDASDLLRAEENPKRPFDRRPGSGAGWKLSSPGSARNGSSWPEPKILVLGEETTKDHRLGRRNAMDEPAYLRKEVN